MDEEKTDYEWSMSVKMQALHTFASPHTFEYKGKYILNIKDNSCKILIEKFTGVFFFIKEEEEELVINFLKTIRG